MRATSGIFLFSIASAYPWALQNIALHKTATPASKNSLCGPVKEVCQLSEELYHLPHAYHWHTLYTVSPESADTAYSPANNDEGVIPRSGSADASQKSGDAAK